MIQIDVLIRRILGDSGTRPRTEAGRASRMLLAGLQSLTITEVLKKGLHEFLVDGQAALDRIGSEVVESTMFYPIETELESQQQQQQQQ